eukprot:COSAG02_NODE_16616_length_1070_cov_1.740474_1_plen_50_part_10
MNTAAAGAMHSRCMAMGGMITRRHRWLRRPVRGVKDWRPRIERYQLAFAG